MDIEEEEIKKWQKEAFPKAVKYVDFCLFPNPPKPVIGHTEMPTKDSIVFSSPVI